MTIFLVEYLEENLFEAFTDEKEAEKFAKDLKKDRRDENIFVHEVELNGLD